MTNGPTFSDEQLTAYLDGEVDHIPADEIRAALEQDATLRARLESLSLETGHVAGAFDSLLDRAPEMPELDLDAEPADTSPGRRNVIAMAAAAVVCLVIGWGAAGLTTGSDLETWDEYVAAYHALYVNGTLAGVDQPETAAAAELEHVSKAVGRNVDLSALKGIDGLDYKRAQILGFEGRPLMQLTFLSRVGAPVALCIIKSADAGHQGMRTQRMLGMSSAHWTGDGYEYLLIGGTDDALIKSVADALVETL